MIKEQLSDGRVRFICERCKYIRITRRQDYQPLCSCTREHQVIKEHLIDEARQQQLDERRALREPSLARKARNFARASTQHALAGFPEATDDQVAERFAICQACEIFKPAGDSQGVCTHSTCGCSLKTVGLTGRNKLRWADQACPLGKWQPLPPAPPTE